MGRGASLEGLAKAARTPSHAHACTLYSVDSSTIRASSDAAVCMCSDGAAGEQAT